MYLKTFLDVLTFVCINYNSCVLYCMHFLAICQLSKCAVAKYILISIGRYSYNPGGLQEENKHIPRTSIPRDDLPGRGLLDQHLYSTQEKCLKASAIAFN